MARPLRVLSAPAVRPGISLELRYLLAAVAYGASIGASIASALWWWLG